MKSIITIKHLELMNKIMLVTGSLVGYAYGMEFFIAWYSGNEYEFYHFFHGRAAGPFWWAWTLMMSCNVLVPQVFWFKKMRRSIPVMFVASILINVGMWFERFVIIVTSLYRDFVPSSWAIYKPTLIDIFTYLGTLGLFFTLFLLFIRWVPMIAVAEVKGVLPAADPHFGHGHAHDHDEDHHSAPAGEPEPVPGE
jgi:molybdopterin-containing oxidoreductase family membrane subunit